MDRYKMIKIIGENAHTSNIESGEYSYVQEAGGKSILESMVGEPVSHFKADIRFEQNDTVVIVETKRNFTKRDEDQLAEYVKEERALHVGKKIVGILANTINDKIKVWQSVIDEKHVLKEETVFECMNHYVNLFRINQQNNREKVLKNTFDLNELLHKMDINENLRSQFVGTSLLYIKDMIKKAGATRIDDKLVERLNNVWKMMDEKSIRVAIEATLGDLLDGSENKTKKIELLQKNVLNDQKVKRLRSTDWINILDTILTSIYKYINADSSEGQDILNMFFIAFNKYTGKADKNQAFTPDHITEFMCSITDVDREKRVLDCTCGSGSFLVQAMVKELADCRRGNTEEETKRLQEKIKKQHIFGIEVEENAYGLSTTNMLIHGDGNSNICFGSIFDNEAFIKKANPNIILMNPPYNAKPKGIPDKYKTKWKKDGKEDPTKGYVFIKYISDIAKEKTVNWHGTKLAVLLPMSAAIGSSTILKDMKRSMLKDNTLEAVFSLPSEIFYPGAAVQACCLVFTLNKPHCDADGIPNKKTFFGYYKEDGFKKKKNLGRIEQFDENNNSKWKKIENEWLSMYKNKTIVPGLSAMYAVTGDDEWLCEAYMKTDYSKLSEADFQQTINDYLSYLVKTGKVAE